MLTVRPVNIQADKDTLLELHCCDNYESETPWARTVSYDAYRRKWLSTSQPESFLASLSESLADPRTIAEIWEQSSALAGFVWVVFIDIVDYNVTIAEVNDIAVSKQYRRKGIGTKILDHVEQLARKRGAHLLRSEAGIENMASDRLHRKAGFKPYRMQYEKVLTSSVTE